MKPGMASQAWRTIMAALLTAGPLALAAEEAPPFVPEEITFSCKPATSPVTVDGWLDEAAWSQAVPITHFYNVQNEGKSFLLPADKVTVRFLYDSQNLYLGAVIKDRDIIFDPTHLNQDKETLFLTGDTFEVFFQPDKKQTVYYEFHVNPNNITWDARFLAKNYLTFFDYAAWDAGMKTAAVMKGTPNTVDEDTSWTVEMAIPLKAFTDRFDQPYPVKGTSWRLSICAYDYSYYNDDCDNQSALMFISSSKLPKIDFHQRGNFNLLKFE